MPYTTVHLRGKDRDIEYRILERCGYGWLTDWRWTSAEDRDDFNEDTVLTAVEEDAVNTAMIIAEGNAP